MSYRDIYINSYIEQIEENNNIFRNMLSIMRNQENTLQRLIFEAQNEDNNRENNFRFANPIRQTFPMRQTSTRNYFSLNSLEPRSIVREPIRLDTRRYYTNNIRNNNNSNSNNNNSNNNDSNNNANSNTNNNTNANTNTNINRNINRNINSNQREINRLVNIPTRIEPLIQNIPFNNSNSFMYPRDYSYARENNRSILRRRRSDSEVDDLLSIVGHNILSTLQRHTNDFINNLDLENVRVVPTAREIEIATHIIPFNSILNPQNSTCPISLTRFETDSSLNVMRIRYCGHLYVPEELETWFTHNCRCPLCRYDIRNYSPSIEELENINRLEINEEQNNDEIQGEEDVEMEQPQEVEIEYAEDVTGEENISTENNSSNIYNPYAQVFTRTFESTSLDDLTNQLSEAFNTSFNFNDVSLNSNQVFGNNFSIQLEGFVERPDVSNN